MMEITQMALTDCSVMHSEYAIIRVSICSRDVDENNRTCVSIEAFPTMPSPGSNPWRSSIFVQPCVLSPMEGMCAQQYPLSYARRVSTENQVWSLVLWVPF